MTLNTLLALLLVVLLLGGVAHAEGRIDGPVTYVIDGDTFVVGNHIHIRLAGIDAPECAYPCADQAARRLRVFIDGKQVRCVAKGRSYKRIVAICRVGDVDIARWLVEHGLARNSSFPPHYR